MYLPTKTKSYSMPFTSLYQKNNFINISINVYVTKFSESKIKHITIVIIDYYDK